jgi:uncharacterized protein
MKISLTSWQRYTSLLYRYRYLHLTAAVILLVLSLWSAGRIGINTRIQEMLPAEHPMVESYDRIEREFSTAAILLTVEGSRSQRNEMILAAHQLASRIEEDPELLRHIRSINLTADKEFLLDYGMLLSELDDLEDFRNLSSVSGLVPFLTAFNDNLEAAWLDEGGDDVSSPSDEQEILDMFRRFEDFAEKMRYWIETDLPDSGHASREMLDALFTGDLYFFSPDYSMLLVRLCPGFSISDRQKLTLVMDRIGAHLRDESTLWPTLKFGTAGDIAQEADEERALGFDAIYPALAALFIIMALFYFSLHSLRSILFALTALAAGILLDLGLIGATLGELNMITSSFGALLVGLGIDFGIHLVSRYGDALKRGMLPQLAMAQTLYTTGRPVAVGAVTTAAAFYALMVSRTAAFRQFGFVAGSGILLVLAAMFTLLPLLLLTWGRGADKRGGRICLEYRFLGKWGALLSLPAIMRLIVVMVILISGFSLAMLPRLHYTIDMRRLGPQNTPAKQTEERIIEAYELTPFPSFLAVDNLEEARRLTEELRDERTIGSVGSPSDYLPSAAEQRERLDFLAAWHTELAPPSPGPGNAAEDLAFEIQRLEWNIIEIADISVAKYGSEGRIIELRDNMIREILGAETGASGRETFQNLIRSIESPRGRERLLLLDPVFAAAVHERFLRLTAPRRPLTAADIPASVRREMVADDDSAFLITLYPTGAIESREGMMRFDRRTHAIDPGITGTIPLSLVLSQDMRTAAGKAVAAVIVVIFTLLLFIFRSLSRTALAFANLLIAVLWMLGFNAWLGELNAVNILALPLILGIGIDYSVHIIHGLEASSSAADALQNYGKAVLLSALTTMIGFGSLAAIGTFRGIATLGMLLFLGAAAALVTSMTLLPALMVRLPETKHGKTAKKENTHAHS